MLVEEAMAGLVIVPRLEESRMEAIKARRTLAVDGNEGEEGLELGSGWFVLDDFLGEEVRHTASWELGVHNATLSDSVIASHRRRWNRSGER